MGKNITIAEGAQAKNFSNVSKIRVNNIGGGTSDWIPEEEAGMYADLEELSVSKNGTYNASDEDVDGFSKVIVKVDPKVTTKTITKNGTYRAKKDKVDGYSEVSVQVPTGGGGELITKSISENGTYNASDDNADGYSSVTVNVSGGGGSLITKEITANGTYNASADGADGYSSVTVNIVPTHGRTINNGLNSAPVSSRISIYDFIMDLSEKAYEIGISFAPSRSALFENKIRNGSWATLVVGSDIFSYNNLVLFGRAGVVGPYELQIIVQCLGIVDESGVVSMTTIQEPYIQVTEDDGAKFAKRDGMFAYRLNVNGTATYGQNVTDVETDIANHEVGAEGIVTKNQSLAITSSSQAYTNILTNLTGGSLT